MATAGLVCGIIALCTSFIPIINNISFVLGILSIVFALVSLKKQKGKCIASIIISIIAIILVIASQQALSDSLNEVSNNFNDITGDHTEEILNNNVDVIIGDYSLSKNEYGFSDSKLKVTVKNKSAEKKSFSIQIEAVSDDGNRIDSEYIYANDINAGQSQDFNIFTYVSSDNYDKMKNATFKIVTVSMY